ncbi:helix-turn-helix domain-containing protein [Stenomitos frigidus]|uniref:Transposase putative helix-turn-helix domain-containing protein n=1 Tax=Stenomitos frigidus ULC18 TaxID=2107698 RepID=A0A2T1DWZ8_9CYAN|nr:helix-turn-helix domain-containing protein [Stenomitos frigidus]PSB24989.1 hypothetical protein C7B82_24835 [Stenomitos frigidus ULC18]
MQVRWNYKLQPNRTQQTLMSEWLVTLRKHRNYCLAERQRGFESNHQDSDEPVIYAYGAFCDLTTRVAYGAYTKSRNKHYRYALTLNPSPTGEGL